MSNNLEQKNKTYTWRDVIQNKKKALFTLTILINCTIVLIVSAPFLLAIPGYSAIGIIGACTNFTTLGISALLAMGAILLFENKLFWWLTQTQLGSNVLSIITLGLGILTMAVMCGISYIWTPAEEIAGNLQEDFYFGALIPFDLTTLILALDTFYVWKIARKCNLCNKSWVHTGLLLAVISFIISCTPLQIVIQGMFISAIKGIEVLK